MGKQTKSRAPFFIAEPRVPARADVEFSLLPDIILFRGKPMDDKSLNLTAESILQKVFKQNVKGYDPDEVDTFLDRVIADYRAYDKYIQDAQAYIQSLETKPQEACKTTIATRRSTSRWRRLAFKASRTMGMRTNRTFASCSISIAWNAPFTRRASIPRPCNTENHIYPTWMAALERERKVHARTACDGGSDCGGGKNNPTCGSAQRQAKDPRGPEPVNVPQRRALMATSR